MFNSEFADQAPGRAINSRLSFLASHRALAACAREFARLSDEVRQQVATLPEVSADEQTKVRQSPDRLIVQLGPVALTVAWLRSSTEPVEAGELLVIVWSGAVAPVQPFQPERPRARSPLAVTALWEQVFTPRGDSETDWGWQPVDAPTECWSSTELSNRCAKQLYAAYRSHGDSR